MVTLQSSLALAIGTTAHHSTPTMMGLRYSSSVSNSMTYYSCAYGGCFVPHAALHVRLKSLSNSNRHHKSSLSNVLIINKMQQSKSLLFASISDDDGEKSVDMEDSDVLDTKAKQYGYKPPAHSDSFLRHLESVKSSWPYDPNNSGDELDDDGRIDDENSNKYKSISADGGVKCTGEPSIDPSRMLQSVVDGENDWI